LAFGYTTNLLTYLLPCYTDL